MTLVRDSSFVLVNTVVQMIVSMGSGVLIARMLGPTGKGEVYLVVQFATLASVLLALGLGPAYLYHLRKRVFERVVLVSHMMWQMFIVGIVLASGASLGWPLLLALTGHSLDNGLLVLALVMTLLNVFVGYLGFAVMALDDGIRLASLINAASGVLYMAVLGVALVTNPTPATAVWCICFATAIRILPLLILVLRWSRPSKQRIPASVSFTLMSYGFASLAGNLTMATVLRLDSFLVNGLAGAGPLGVYSVATSLGEVVLLVPSAVGVALFPHLTGLRNEAQVATMARVSRLTMIVSPVVAAGLAVVGLPAITLMFGSRFAAAYVPFLGLLPGLIALSLVYAFSNYFSSRGEPWINALVFGFATGLNLLLNVLLIGRLGVFGAALASSVTYACAALGFLAVLGARGVASPRLLLVPTGEDVGMLTRVVVGVLRRPRSV